MSGRRPAHVAMTSSGVELRRREELVRVLAEVLDVGERRRDLATDRRASRCRSCRSRCARPTAGEHHALVAREQRDRVRQRQARVVDDDVHALRRRSSGRPAPSFSSGRSVSVHGPAATTTVVVGSSSVVPVSSSCARTATTPPVRVAHDARSRACSSARRRRAPSRRGCSRARAARRRSGSRSTRGCRGGRRSRGPARARAPSCRDTCGGASARGTARARRRATGPTSIISSPFDWPL